MIKQVLDRDFVLRHLNIIGEHLDREIDLQQSGDAQALQRACRTGVTASDLVQAKTALAQAQDNPKAREIRAGQQVFLPPDATTSSLQTAMQRTLIERQPEMLVAPATLQPSSAPITDVAIAAANEENIFEQFGPADLGWLSVGFASILKLLRGPRKFTPDPAPPCKIANSSRLILLSDWGTGIPRARKVAESARVYLEEAARAGTEVHVIHLGDVYYSGFAAEYDAHFLPFWPVRP